MSMETKMAGSVDNVLSMITSLLAKGMANNRAHYYAYQSQLEWADFMFILLAFMYLST